MISSLDGHVAKDHVSTMVSSKAIGIGSPDEQEEVGLFLYGLRKLPSRFSALDARNLTKPWTRTHFSLTMSSTFCTVVLTSLPVKSNRTPSDVTLRPLPTHVSA